MKRFKVRIQPIIKSGSVPTTMNIRVRDNNQARLESLSGLELSFPVAQEINDRTQLTESSKLVKLYNITRIMVASDNKYFDFDKIQLDFIKFKKIIQKSCTCIEYDLILSVLMHELLHVRAEIERYHGYSDEYLRWINRFNRKFDILKSENAEVKSYKNILILI